MIRRAPIPVVRIITIIDNFLSQIKTMASQLSLFNEGPFPLDYDDFFHNNLMVDENSFDVIGIIDWEGACTVPWDDFLAAMLVSFDLP